MAKGKGPVKSFKFGSITVNLWEKENPKNPDWGPIRSYQLSKSYKTAQGEWKNMDVYFNRTDELMCAIMALQAAINDRYSKNDTPENTDFLDGI